MLTGLYSLIRRPRLKTIPISMILSTKSATMRRLQKIFLFSVSPVEHIKSFLADF